MSTQLSQEQLTLYSYWRSSCSWRVRLLLHYKGIAFQTIPVNLLKQEHTQADFVGTKSATATVPALIHGNHVLSESLAIMEYVEEVFKDTTPTLPSDAFSRAKVRCLSLIIVADTQPIQNLKVLIDIERLTSKEEREKWAKKWIAEGLNAYESSLQKQKEEGKLGDYSFGSQVSLADFCLIPQLYNARRFGINVEEQFPLSVAIEKRCEGTEWFRAAHPDQQIDNPEKKN